MNVDIIGRKSSLESDWRLPTKENARSVRIGGQKVSSFYIWIWKALVELAEDHYATKTNSF